MTPGQAAYEAFERIWPEESWGPWDIMGDDDDGKPGWEAVAQAAIEELASPESWATLAAERDRLRAVAADMLSRFGPSVDGHAYARAGQVQIAKWREAAGLEG